MFWITLILILLGSRKKTGFTPLGKVKKAAVVIDGDAPDAAETEKDIRRFFDARGIAVQVSKACKGRFIKVKRKVELFVSLLPENGWKNEYVSRRSRACFKAGRFPTKKETYDLVVSDPQGKHFPQREVWKTISGIIDKVK